MPAMTEAEKAYSRQWYKAHRQERIDAARAYRLKNKERNREWQAKYRETHKDQITAYNKQHNAKPETKKQQWLWRLRTEYGLTESDFLTMWADQQGECKCCRRPMSLVAGKGDSVNIDHDHSVADKRESVRHLLCHRCNVTVGLVEENPAIARCIVAYTEGLQT